MLTKETLLTLYQYRRLSCPSFCEEELMHEFAQTTIDHLGNRLLSVFREQNPEQTCIAIHPFPCCAYCHEEEGLLAPRTLQDGRTLLCCCSATRWLESHDLLYDEFHPIF